MGLMVDAKTLEIAADKLGILKDKVDGTKLSSEQSIGNCRNTNSGCSLDHALSLYSSLINSFHDNMTSTVFTFIDYLKNYASQNHITAESYNFNDADIYKK